MRITAMTALLAVAAVAPPLLAQKEQFHWGSKIAPGLSIEIKGVNGNVRAEPVSGDRVEVVAAKTGRRSDPRDVDIQVIDHADGVTICAVYPSEDSRPNECRPGSGGRMNVRDNDVKVDFTVRVPAGVHFIGRTVNGDIAASSLTGDIDAHTVNGGVKVSTSGSARAQTVNGSITASMGKVSPKPLRFETVNGSITVELPSAASAEIRAETVNGSISTDFPLTVQGRFIGRRISGKIGSGGPELSLKSVNGSIQLRRAGMKTV